MNKFKKLAVVMAAVASVGTFAGCSMVEKTPEKIQKEENQTAATVIAKVNGKDITQGMLDKQFKPTLESYKLQGVDPEKDTKAREYILNAKKGMAENLVKQEVYLATAQKKGFTATNENVKKTAEEYKKNTLEQFGSEDKLKEALKAQNLTYEDYLKQVENAAMIDAMFTDITKDNKVNEASVNDYYKLHLEDKYTTLPGADIFHILFKDEAAAKEGKKELNAGAKFEDVAKKYGQDGTKDSGGSLGFVMWEKNQMVPEFIEYAKKLKEGEISEPVKTQFGWHIIKVSGIKSEKVVKPLADVKAEIEKAVKQEMDQKTITDSYATWEKENKVEKFFDKIK